MHGSTRVHASFTLGVHTLEIVRVWCGQGQWFARSKLENAQVEKVLAPGRDSKLKKHKSKKQVRSKGVTKALLGALRVPVKLRATMTVGSARVALPMSTIGSKWSSTGKGTQFQLHSTRHLDAQRVG